MALLIKLLEKIKISVNGQTFNAYWSFLLFLNNDNTKKIYK